MEITPALIDRFFEGNCTIEEIDAVNSCLTPGNPGLEEFAGKKEWDAIHFESCADDDRKKQLLDKIKQSLFNNNTAGAKLVVIRRLHRFIAAAVFILAVAACWWQFGKLGNRPQPFIVENNTGVELPAGKSLQSNWITRFNHGKKPGMVRLSDGSKVTLYPNTVIRYPQPFTGGRREIQLSGDAFFEVAKNRQLPFVVTTGELSTTALGTSFRIAARGQGSISVKLFTGKVVVKSAGAAATGKTAVLLSPGEELRYDYLTLAVRVTRFKVGAAYQPAAVLTKVPETRISDTLRFNSTQLPEVFQQLSVLYNISIDYSSAAIHEINFTGIITRSDEIHTVLKAITLMNRLQVTKSANGFVITRL